MHGGLVSSAWAQSPVDLIQGGIPSLPCHANPVLNFSPKSKINDERDGDEM